MTADRDLFSGVVVKFLVIPPDYFYSVILI